MSDRLVPYGLGQTGANGDLSHLLGTRGYFLDVDHASTATVKPVTTGHTIEAIWVQNGHSAAVTPSQIVVWDSTNPAIETAAPVGTLGVPAGVVDPFLPAAGVAVDAYYWLIVKGPCKVITDGSETISILTALATKTSGKVQAYDATNAADNIGRVGFALENPAEVDGTKFRAFVDIQF